MSTHSNDYYQTATRNILKNPSLKKYSIRLYFALILAPEGWTHLSVLQELLGCKDRSTVHKAANELVAAKLVERKPGYVRIISLI